MKKYLIPIAAASAVFAILAIRNARFARNSHDFLVSQNSTRDEVPEPPAKDSAEWLERFRGEKRLIHAFAELPRQAEWGPVIERLGQPGEHRSAKKERLFGAALQGDREGAELALRELLLSDTDETAESYSRDKALGYLYSFSDDPEATRIWVEKSLPEAKADEYRSYDPDRDEVHTLLSEDRVTEAIDTLLKMAAAESAPGEKLVHLGRTAKIARLMDRQELHDRILSEMKSLALGASTQQGINVDRFDHLIAELARVNDWATLGKIGDRFKGDSGDKGFHLLSISAKYHTGGPAAFLQELRILPDIGIINQKDYAHHLIASPIHHRMSLGEMTVRALMATGESEKARVTLEYLLALDMGDDAFYRLAIELFPSQAEAMFVALRPYTPYEERPLIWLGEIALGKNDLVQAQAFVDQAITLDPSDGEQGKFTRMQVYDVLSRILRAKGDTGKADFFNGVMKAIRQGEEADDYLYAGLTQEAIRRYQEALGHFGDAYCLQSRLAKTLMKAGKEEEAMKHFEKAFELMPVSFGPVESHCFGCEGVFEGERVKEIAVRTFNRIIEATPENPRTFYLLGLVLKDMKLPDEAAAAMSRALELDPGYYNCAKRLLDLVEKNPESAGTAESLRKKLAGMAPYPDLQRIYHARADLRQLWEEAQSPPPCPLALSALPLPFDLGKKPEKRRNWTYYHQQILDPLDGWSTEELLKDNNFVRWIEDF